MVEKGNEPIMTICKSNKQYLLLIRCWSYGVMPMSGAMGNLKKRGGAINMSACSLLLIGASSVSCVHVLVDN